MNGRKLAGYTLSIISLLAVAVAVFALLALFASSSNVIPAALTILFSLVIAYIARHYGTRLRT